MTTLNELRKTRSGNRKNIDHIKSQMHQELQHYRLQELRKELGITQSELAKHIGVGQNRVSQLEGGKLTNTKVVTLKKYLEALGAELELTVKQPDGSRLTLDIPDEANPSDLADV